MKPDVHTLKTKSKLSPEVEPFVPKLQKDQDIAEEVAAPLGHLTLPNPYIPKALRGALLRNSGDQAVGGNVSPQTGDGLSKHGYSHSRRGRGAARRQADPAQESSPLKKPGKTFSTPWPSPDLVSNDKVIRRPLGVAKAKQKVSREPKPTPEAAEKTKHPLRDADTFEIKQSDFPELSFPTPSRPAPQHCWGSSTSRPSPYKQGQSGHSAPSPSHAEKGEATRGSLLPSPGSSTASWASVASQPPRKPAPKLDRGLNSPTQKEDKSEFDVEQTSEKRKQKKKKKNKKKKSKPTSDEDEVKAGAVVIEQEPPKFEDEEEFPDLALASSGKSEAVANRNTKNRPNEMQEGREPLHQREGTGLPPADLGKTRATAGQHPPPAQSAEPRKAQPKAEKTSGKKSKVPVQLDLGNMLAVLEKKQLSQKSKQDPKSIILSVGGAIPVVHKDPSTQKKHPRQLERVAHNPLDSTSPLVKKGKQREVPKAKKPTPLKRIILKEREERKQHRLLEERGVPPQANDSEPSDRPAEAAQETLVLEQNQQTPTDGQATPFSEQPTEDRLVQSESELGEGTEEPSQEVAPTEASLPCRPKIHSRKFRDYCSQVLSRDVDECVTGLLKELVRFQDRLYQKDPMKARMKRRLVMGLREVLKHLRLRKVKCVVISPNCERIQSKGGLDDALHTIIDTCREQAVPFVFALSRKALGRCVNKAVPVSLVGIFNYDGAQDLYHKMIELSSEARNAYEVMIANLEQTSQEQQETPTECQNSVSTVDQSEIEEPEYIKVWKRMLEECNHHVLNFEAKLTFTAVASDSGPQADEEERS